MPDQRITDMTELTTPATTDIIVIVHDPSGTPINYKVSRINFVNSQAKIINGVVYHQLYISRGFQPTLTNGCADWAQVEMTTNKNVYDYLAFDKDNIKYAYANFPMPSDYTGGGIYAKFYWTHPATTTNFGVRWALEAAAITDDGTLDVAAGTAVGVTDTGGTTSDLYISPLSGAMTPSGTPAANKLMYFKLWRYPAYADDNLAVDAYFLGVMLYYPVA